jgi:hypothetical protein
LDTTGVGVSGSYSLDVALEGTTSLPSGGTVSISCTGTQTAFSTLIAEAVDVIN